MKAEDELRYVEGLIEGYEGTGYRPPTELLVRAKALRSITEDAEPQAPKKPNTRHLVRAQQEERRQAIGVLVREYDIPSTVVLADKLRENGYTLGSDTLRQDLSILGISRYRPGPGERVRLVQVEGNDEYLTTKKLLEFTLANASAFALREVIRKGDRLFLECTNGTARHLADALQERVLPGVVSVMSDSYSTIWLEASDEYEARDIETALRRFMILGG